MTSGGSTGALSSTAVTGRYVRSGCGGRARGAAITMPIS
jgi:hypothetical protein